jgi:hypothetical protein
MAITPSSITIDKCYVTPTEQVRKVLEIDDEKVKYVSRGQKATPKWAEKGSRRSTTRTAFANEVDREVFCHWDPDYPERKP